MDKQTDVSVCVCVCLCLCFRATGVSVDPLLLQHRRVPWLHRTMARRCDGVALVFQEKKQKRKKKGAMQHHAEELR